jgi:hypothetical protein
MYLNFVSRMKWISRMHDPMTVRTKNIAIEEWRSSSAAALGGRTGSAETVGAIVEDVVDVEVWLVRDSVEFDRVPFETGIL